MRADYNRDKNLEELEENKQKVLNWIGGQQKGVSIASFNWLGYQLEKNDDTGKITVIGEEFETWEDALNRIMEALVR